WTLPFPRDPHEDRSLADRYGVRYTYSVPVQLGVVFSLAIGFLSSFFGIGGGILQVPGLVSVLGFPTHIATATSQFVLAFMSGTGTLTHVVAGSLGGIGHGLRRTVALSIGVIAGAQVGALASVRLSARVIKMLLV